MTHIGAGTLIFIVLSCFVRTNPAKNMQSGTHTPPRLYFLQDRHWSGPGPQQPSEEHRGSHTWPSLTIEINRKAILCYCQHWFHSAAGNKSYLFTHRTDVQVCYPWDQFFSGVAVGGSCCPRSGSSLRCHGNRASRFLWCTRRRRLFCATSVTPGRSKRGSLSPEESTPWVMGGNRICQHCDCAFNILQKLRKALNNSHSFDFDMNFFKR